MLADCQPNGTPTFHPLLYQLLKSPCGMLPPALMPTKKPLPKRRIVAGDAATSPVEVVDVVVVVVVVPVPMEDASVVVAPAVAPAVVPRLPAVPEPPVVSVPPIEP